jgi:acyl-CoA synthetase (AMP-forming)/AMP-acid ligase II
MRDGTGTRRLMTAIAGLLAREAHRMPQREALIFGDRTTTYAEFDAEVDRHAAALSALGVTKSDRVALLAANSDRYLLAFFAGLRLGAIIVPINTRLAAPEVAHILEDSGARVLVFDPELEALAYESRALVALNPPELVGLRAAGDVPDLEALAAAAPPDWEPPEVHEGDEALILYTSGTTGHPKGVLLDHRRAIWAALSEIATLGLKDGERYLHLVPFYHSGGVTYAITLTMLAGTHVILPSFTPSTLLDAIERHRCTFFLGVPTMFQMLLREPGLSERDLSSWRLAVFGAAPMPRAAVEAMIAAFPQVELVQMCGQTEAGPAGLYATAAQVRERPDTSGRQAMVFYEHRVVDAEGRDVAPGEIGEVLYRGPGVMKGYWNQPEATEETLRDGWLHSGDLVRLDPDGYMTVVDRLKDMIITGGRNVYTQEVERVVVQHPGVRECAVIGRPHDIYGESIIAVVTPTEVKAPSLEDLREHCRASLADFKLPHDVLVVDELPRNPGGKVLKRELRTLVHG